MDPPLVNEASFTAASNPSSYSLAELLSFPMGGGGGLGLTMGGGALGDGSLEESTVTEQSGNGGVKRRRDDSNVGYSFDDDSSKLVSTSNAANHDLNESNGKRTKATGSRDDENCGLKAEAESNSGTSVKLVEEKSKPEPPKDYIHVRARRGQATDSHSLAERARREKISERMKILQDLVPGCNKVIGKALVLDEIINYVQSLQHQVEFLSMKLEAVNARLSPTIEGFPPKDKFGKFMPYIGLQSILVSLIGGNKLTTPTFDASGMMFGSQPPREYSQGTQAEWLHMQIGNAFERAT